MDQGRRGTGRETGCDGHVTGSQGAGARPVEIAEVDGVQGRAGLNHDGDGVGSGTVDPTQVEAPAQGRASDPRHQQVYCPPTVGVGTEFEIVIVVADGDALGDAGFGGGDQDLQGVLPVLR